MKKFLFPMIFIAVLSIGLVFMFGNKQEKNVVIEEEKEVLYPATSAFNATYNIDGKSVTLIEGFNEEGIAPGSASKTITGIFDTPVHGDVNNDGVSDTAFFISQDMGGSGTFYYIAVAVKKDGFYEGLNAVFLGDRIAPHTIEIRNGIIVANYAKRLVGEEMSKRPSFAVSKYTNVKNNILTEFENLEEGKQVFQGYVTIGHEAREFKRCGTEEVFWLGGSSPAYDEITQKYNDLNIPVPYTPVFAILTGEIVGSPQDGFGAEYDFALSADSLIVLSPENNCNSNLIRVTSPLPGTSITSPLSLTGFAKGSWFFEGDAPVMLTDWDGKIIAEGYVTAQNDWMTEKLVPFTGELTFKKPTYGKTGSIIFKKDNPSDLPEHDMVYEFIVSFEDVDVK